MKEIETMSVNSLDVSRLKEEIAEKTKAIEVLVGNLDLKLLSNTLKEREKLLKKLIPFGESDGEMLYFLRRIMARDAVTRSRLLMISGDLRRRIKNLDLERIARRRYVNSSGDGGERFRMIDTPEVGR